MASGVLEEKNTNESTNESLENKEEIAELAVKIAELEAEIASYEKNIKWLKSALTRAEQTGWETGWDKGYWHKYYAKRTREARSDWESSGHNRDKEVDAAGFLEELEKIFSEMLSELDEEDTKIEFLQEIFDEIENVVEKFETYAFFYEGTDEFMMF